MIELKDLLPVIPIAVVSGMIGWIQFLKYKIDAHDPLILLNKDKKLLGRTWVIAFESVDDKYGSIDKYESIDRGAYFVQLYRRESMYYGESFDPLPVHEYHSAMKKLCKYGLMEMKITDHYKWKNGIPPKLHNGRTIVIGQSMFYQPTQYGELYFYAHIGTKKGKESKILPETWQEDYKDSDGDEEL